MSKIQSIGQFLRQAFACPRCGKSMMVAATAWRGHGTGRHGSAYYNATAHEAVSIETHCTCPGGPCDQAGLVPHDEAYEALKAKIEAERAAEAKEDPPF